MSCDNLIPTDLFPLLARRQAINRHIYNLPNGYVNTSAFFILHSQDPHDGYSYVCILQAASKKDNQLKQPPEERKNVSERLIMIMHVF